MEGEGGEKKEVRRPMNAFLIFCKRHRSVVREKNPDMDNRSVTRVLGDLWANLGEEKATYTNLAKQYKDAFMKANPNYKWHSADKSQSSSSKAANKPTNSRVIKNIPELTGDGSITPGKLADPEKMGGLNLLLMADKETREVRPSSTLSTLTSATFSKAPVASRQEGQSDCTDTSNSALLQLAEMCTSELQSSTKELPPMRFPIASQSHTQLSKLQPQTGVSSDPPQPTSSPSPVHQPMPPPKKRARHWSLTEPDGEVETLNYDNTKDNKSSCAGNSHSGSNLSPLNLSVHKPRCISTGSADDKFSHVEKYKSTSGRRRLSSSATESIPSPTFVDGMEDADSPVFTSDHNKSDNYAFTGKRNDNQGFSDRKSGPQFSPSSNILSKNHGLFTEEQNLSSSGGNSKPSGKSEQPREIQSTLLQQPSSFSACKRSQHPHHLAGEMPQTSVSLPTTRSLLGHGQQMSTLSESQLQSVDQSFSSLHTSITESNHKWSLEQKSPDFYQWREPGKSKSRTAETAPNLKFAQATAENVTSSILSRLNQPVSTSSSVGSKKDNITMPLATTLATSGSMDFSSLLSEGRIASLLSSPDTPPPKFSRNSNLFEKEEAEKNTGHSKHGIECRGFQNADQKVSELSVPTVKPSSQIPHNYSEGKLKKKWTERSLVEAKMEEDLIHQRQLEGGANKGSDTNSSPQSGFSRGLEPGQKNSQTALGTSKSMNSSEKRSDPKNPNQLIDSKLFHNAEPTPQSGAQNRLILNQPLDSLKAFVGPSHKGLAFNDGSSSSSLQLQLAQKQQQLKPKGFQAETGFGDVKMKSEKDSTSKPLSFGDNKLGLNQQQDTMRFGRDVKGLEACHNLDTKPCIGENTDNKGMERGVNNNNGTVSQGLGDKHILNQITARGQKFMDHIVEQLFRSDFAVEKPMDSLCAREGKEQPFPAVKLETSASQRLEGENEENMDRWIKRGRDQDYKVLTASSLVEKVVREVCGSPSKKPGCTSCRKLDQADNSESQPSVKEENPSSLVSESPPASVVNTLSKSESASSFEMYRQTPSSPGNDADSQSQRSAQTPESCEQSDQNEDTGLQPVRKSRRANRGQKYQELIKEGFIQPSRERMAARNAERQHGRSFGTREEYERLENRKTLKRSVSERDTMPYVATMPNSTETGNDVSDADKRYTTGDFDLEKEIESLPVCSIDQLGKKRGLRRRCESETLLSVARHRSNSDASVSSSANVGQSASRASHGSVWPVKIEVELKEDQSCPAPHILLPKEERPTEPVTGSRKRKARRHCITRISLLEEGKKPSGPPKKPCQSPQPSLSPTSDSVKTSGSPKEFSVSSVQMSEPSTANTVPEEHMVVKKAPFPPTSSLQLFTAGSTLNSAPVKDQSATTMHNLTASLQTSVHPKNPPKESNKSQVPAPFTGKKKSPKPLVPTSLPQPETSEKMDTSPKCLWDGKPLLTTSIGGLRHYNPSLTNVSSVNHSREDSTKVSTSVVSSLLRTEKTPLNPPFSSAKVKTETMEKQTLAESSRRKQIKAKNSQTGDAEKDTDMPSRKQRKTVKKADAKKTSEGITKKSRKKASQPVPPPPTLSPPKDPLVKSDRATERIMQGIPSSGVSPLVSRLFGTVPCQTPFVKEITNERASSTVLKSLTEVVNLPSQSEAIPSPSHVTTVNLNETVTRSLPGGIVPHISLASKPFQPAFAATSTINLMSGSRPPSLLKPPPSQLLTSRAVTEGETGVSSHSLNASANTTDTPRNIMTSTHSSIWSSRSVPYQTMSPQPSHCSQSMLSHPSSPAAAATTTLITCNVSATTTAHPASPSLLPLPQCPTTPSSTSTPAITVSLTTSGTSASNDIGSYAVISSSSVMDAGSPHMIGSPHLPESPSVAVVQS